MTLAEYAGMLRINTSWYANLDIVKNSVGYEKISDVKNNGSVPRHISRKVRQGFRQNRHFNLTKSRHKSTTVNV